MVRLTAAAAAAASLLLGGCAFGVVQEPDLFDTLCDVLPDIRAAADDGDDDAIAALAEPIVDVVPSDSESAFTTSLRDAAIEAQQGGDTDALVVIARANCLDEQ